MEDNTTPQQYQRLDYYDTKLTLLLAGNNQKTKATTVSHVDFAAVRNFTVQTVRDEQGDWVAIVIVDKDGSNRFILPPRIVNTIVRHRDSLTARMRSNTAKARAKERGPITLSEEQKRKMAEGLKRYRAQKKKA